MLLLCLLALTAGDTHELVRDPTFIQGLTVLDPKPGKRVEVGTLHFGQDGPPPVWSLAQWSSRFPVTDFTPKLLDDGGLAVATEGKRVVRSPQGELTLEVFGNAEYGGRARGRRDPWVHLLLGQRFQCPLDLAHIGEVPFSVEARLLNCRKYDSPDYSPNVHATHYQLFVTVQNLNRQSAGYGDFLWFGVAMYDDRWRVPHRFVAGDKGSGKLIYTPLGDTYTDQSMQDGEWVTFQGDLLPEIRKALDVAWERGFLKDSHDLADYRLGGMNLGWEVPGLFDCAVVMRGLSLKVVEANP